mgnify:CR=1 FL=1
MELKDIKPNSGKIDVVVHVVNKEPPRTFDKFGKKGRVCNALVQDATAKVTLTLWNDDVDKVEVGDKVHLQNGWCSEYKGEKQLSAGKFGTIEVLGKSDLKTAPEVFTNDPGMLNPVPGGDGDDDGDDSGEEPVDAEEFVEE